MKRIFKGTWSVISFIAVAAFFVYGAKRAFILEPTDWSKTNRGIFANGLETEPRKIAEKIVEQSRDTWPKPVDEAVVIKMKVDLESCIHEQIRKMLDESKDSALNQPATMEVQEAFLKPILEKCAEYRNK